jgi:hypothetical protein
MLVFNGILEIPYVELRKRLQIADGSLVANFRYFEKAGFTTYQKQIREKDGNDIQYYKKRKTGFSGISRCYAKFVVMILSKPKLK